MENSTFRNKDDLYYNIPKDQIVALIPEGHHIILDLGCASGRLGSRLRYLKKVDQLIGVEIFKDAADEAARYYDKVYTGDIETMNLEYVEHFDFVICGDILEHLKSPWEILRQIHTWLKTDGHIVASIPNIRYWRILRDLVFLGRWNYVEAGILDSTHLRFFTRRSFVNALEETGFHVEYLKMKVDGTKHRLCNQMTFHLFEEFLGSQATVVARKRPLSGEQ